jgi:hypothetical protein
MSALRTGVLLLAFLVSDIFLDFLIVNTKVLSAGCAVADLLGQGGKILVIHYILAFKWIL